MAYMFSFSIKENKQQLLAVSTVWRATSCQLAGTSLTC